MWSLETALHNPSRKFEDARETLTAKDICSYCKFKRQISNEHFFLAVQTHYCTSESIIYYRIKITLNLMALIPCLGAFINLEFKFPILTQYHSD